MRDVVVAFRRILPFLAILFATVAAAREQGSDWVDVVRDFGARGDGTADDTDAIQRALDTVADGKTFYFPSGTYRITRMLEMRHPARLRGVSVLGDGASTVLAWHGGKGGRIVRDSTLSHSRFEDFVLDGRNLATVGVWSDNMNKFKTQNRLTRVEFRNLSGVGYLSEENGLDGLSDAELTFTSCVFLKCGEGVRFTSYNDYDFTFRGCRFADCGTGISCRFGNFYASACRFERNGLDVRAEGIEHAASVRRSVSVGSERFFAGASACLSGPVASVTIENCTVSDWGSAAGAIDWRGAMLTFGNTFQPKRSARIWTRKPDHLVEATGRRPALALPSDRSFVRATRAAFPKRIFDVRRDFGAVGDGKADDTESIRRAVAAARAFGTGAMAYLPSGTYRTTSTLELSGGPYAFGGTGCKAAIVFDGDRSTPAIRVKDPAGLELRQFHVCMGDFWPERYKEPWDGKPGAEILQEGSGRASSVCYDGVIVYGKYQALHTRRTTDLARRGGLVLRNLGKGDRVNIDYMEGNLRLENCGNATVIGGIWYEGSLVVSGGTGKGFIGAQVRLCTSSDRPIAVRDSSSVVVSDFYFEQGFDYLIDVQGGPRDRPGRVTVGLAKFQRSAKDAEKSERVQHLVRMDGFCGSLNLAAPQFYRPYDADVVQVDGSAGTLNLLCPVAYGCAYRAAPGIDLSTERPASACDDLTHLGWLDLKMNYK